MLTLLVAGAAMGHRAGRPGSGRGQWSRADLPALAGPVGARRDELPDAGPTACTGARSRSRSGAVDAGTRAGEDVEAVCPGGDARARAVAAHRRQCDTPWTRAAGPAPLGVADRGGVRARTISR